MREIVLDTETTGFYHNNGDKIVEIGAVELVNHLPTGKVFHKYINPEREIPEAAYKVHGLNYKFLRDKPTFIEIAESFLEFISDDKLVIHNAKFDIGFLNMELLYAKKSQINYNQVIDTLLLAREKFPGSPASLDALCRRFAIDNSKRKLHGALLDSEILADVYLELIGGRQPNLGLTKTDKKEKSGQENLNLEKLIRVRNLKNRLTREEREAHENFLKKINTKQNWS